VEGGYEPQPGVQVQPWGPERIDERMLGLLAKYDTGLPPQSPQPVPRADGSPLPSRELEWSRPREPLRGI
jgi:hypothetical protein